MAPTPASVTDINQYVATQTQPAQQRWETALLNSSNLRSRAVGLIMQERGELVSDELAVQTTEARDELVQLAAGADDPTVYGLAVGQCQKQLLPGTGTGACGRISLSRWAQLDPDNAAPWLALAQAAHKAGNAQEEASAVAKAAQAQQISSPGQSLLSLAQSEMPQDLTPLEKAALSIEFIGIEAASVIPVYSETTRYCSVDAIRQNETRAECDSLANLLVNRGDSLIDFSIGQRLGERLGWPSERLGELAQERTALFKLVPADQANFWSCASLARTNAFMEKRMKLGELQALRYFKENPPP